MTKRMVIGLLLAAAVIGITVAGVMPRGKEPLSVQFTTPRRQSITRTITAAGKVEAATTVKINSNVSGALIELNVKVSDRVHKGQILAKVDPMRYRAQAKSAEAALSAAEADVRVLKVQWEHNQAELARIQALHAKGMAASAEVDRQQSLVASDEGREAAARRRADQARALLEEANDSLAKCTLVSPIDGEVIELNREQGERVRGSDLSEDVVMILATLSQMEVKVEVGEHEVVYLHVGDQAKVQLDAFEDKEFPGQVVEIGQNAIVRNRGTEAEVTTFPIRVALERRPPGGLPGMSATVRVATETHENVVVLPIQAVTVRPDVDTTSVGQAGAPAPVEPKPNEPKAPAKNNLKKVVFVVKDNLAELRPVRTGLSSDADIEIVEGLSEADTVVAGPYRTIAKELKHGDPVREQAAGDSPSRGVEGS